MGIRTWTNMSCLLVALSAGTASAQSNEPGSQLRDALIRHFSQNNLVPVLLPRNQEVGDVLDTRGTVYARRGDCFPGLKVRPARSSDSLQDVAISWQAEGNFGLSLKSIVGVFASAKTSSNTNLSIAFNDQSYVSASTLELKKAYSKEKCPFLAAIVEGKAEGPEAAKHPFLVLQEVFYAKKMLTIAIGKDADVEAELKKVKAAITPLVASGRLGAQIASGNRIHVESAQSVPIAVRVAFLPTAISGTTLGSGGSPMLKKVYWRPSSADAAGNAKNMALIYEVISADTAGEYNPLINDD